MQGIAMPNDLSDEIRNKGAQKRRDILGDKYLDTLTSESNTFDQPYHDFVTEVLWGRAWCESSMNDDLKLRLNIAMFTVLGNTEDLAPYIRAAVKHGIPVKEIREIITLAALYSGLPNGFRAMYVARDILSETAPSASQKNRAIQVFDKKDAIFETFRSAGKGHQSVCEWVGPGSGARYQAGIAELSHIRIADYEFAFDDFLYVLEGSITITDPAQSVTLTPGQAVLIPEGAVVTMEVPNRLLWTYVAYSDHLHWKDTPKKPRCAEEI